MKFTPDQEKVIRIRNHNVLVSAAAGSGKTAVLVERIIGLITDREHPVDIDRLLVVTFTNAAAAEMRERILRVINERLEDEPDDANLKKQSVLIHHAMITTIDSFCRFLLLNHFQEISLDPGFTVGEPGRIRLMQKEALFKVMEASYAKTTEPYPGYYEDFIRLTDAFSYKGKDDRIEEMAEQIFSFIMSQPYPEAWMMEALTDYEISGCQELSKLPFMKELCKEAVLRLQNMCSLYDRMLEICEKPDGPSVYTDTLAAERELLKAAAGCEGYDGMYDALCRIDFERLPTAKKGCCAEECKEGVQALRNHVKDCLKALREDYFYAGTDTYASDMQKAGKLLKPLLYLTKAFMEQFAEDKRKENIIDFSDMEHFALDILIDQEGQPTETAKWYQNHFEAVMIDEYQDSNDVQELLLSAVSRERDEVPDRFMVGDMKQSIYKFRMARPEIFLEKYNTYGKDEASQSIRIDLKQNFRSRKSVLSSVNRIFFPLMHAEIGGIDYDEAAALYPGADYPDDREDHEQFRTELLVFEKKENEDEKTELPAAQGEALLIANRIKELLKDGSVTDKETGEQRPVRYDDIVILLRSVGSLANKIQEVLKKEGIPTVVPSKTGYFSSQEIQVLMQYLEVCINPYRDIPLVAVLKSPLFGFSDEELAGISLLEAENEQHKGESLCFYEKLKLSGSRKVKEFLDELIMLRKAAKTESVHDLLYRIIRMHRYAEYVAALPAGGSRRENLNMLLEQANMYEKNRMRGLFGFLQYMKQLEKYEIDYGSGNEDGANAVRIMTIHKSKGLEFSICFVSGLSTAFHRRDLRSPLLLHTDLGIGLESRDYEKRMRRATIKQRWIAGKLLADSMGEELRVLYVALTRAREKCILTGVTNDFEEDISKCSLLLQTEMKKDISKRRLDAQIILDSNSYFKLLSYIFAVYGDHRELLPQIRRYHESDLVTKKLEASLENSLKKEALIHLISESDTDRAEEIKSKINFIYPHAELKGLYNKTSVSQLKHAALHEDEQTYVLFDTEKQHDIVPRFLSRDEKPSGATRGTAYHRLMELLDFSAFAGCIYKERELGQGNIPADGGSETEAVLMSQKQEILAQGLMTKEDMELVDFTKLIAFFEGDLAKDMICAALRGELFREQPFVMEIPAKRADKRFPEGESMLIQGIIDAFYIKEDAVYLMDYKTDRVDKKQDLIARYQVQLDLYKEALEKLTGKPVVKVMVYSFFFSAMIES